MYQPGSSVWKIDLKPTRGIIIIIITARVASHYKASQVHQSAATLDTKINTMELSFLFFFNFTVGLSPDLTLKPPVKTIIVITCNARIIFN